ncbi:flagellar hook-basal body complex protein [Arcobacter cryaerophilus gv. pseudocryaerophilus]|uniref:Flagellar hook-basal body complex protein n=3 Tax=unclassified Arcobacter TaxID=2593671 RepID=A0AA96DQK3_9BACT|nr:flagellar hook-basal body complex protein [Arcobacter sp. AZ-2023]WPD06248.1 flagellar hook-basal body complex protein [Arcobacter sp. DSM 115956]WPD08339.1 flagellar hook-basal body complex protein [Arcobacter sp. DSM 115955]WNL32604.1 flagellar hook-basal body complex protein [Arcobacter sp. AZ-2023]WNP38754.1 flagellar hook-basal body complex protein [Arcobacter sp. AZ-2023]
MIGAMWNGIAGIWQHDKGIAVESNNLANSNTVGHKKDQISFSDVLYNQAGFGKGVQTQTISKQFEQGNIVQSGVGIDVAIDGKGFFVVKSRENPNEIYYTRAGNLVQAKDGFLTTQDDYKVQGLVPQSKITTTTNPLDMMFTDEYTKSLVSSNINGGSGTVYNINAKASDYVSSSKDDDILKKGDGYKTSQNKINDIEALKADYIEKLNKFLMDQSTTNTPSISQKSQIDFSSNLSSLQATDNTISVTIDNKTYSVKFDVNSTINDEEMQKLYDFLDTNGKAKYNLVDPNSIQNQANIDAMPTTTPQEILDKATAQALRDNQISSYINANSVVNAMKDLSDKISAKEGMSSSVKDGTLVIDTLIAGGSFNISDIKLNDTNFSSTKLQEAVKGSGLAMVDSARDALKNAVENADGKFLQITNVLEYGNLGVIGENDINVRLDELGISDKSTADISISDDGFVFVKSQGHSFLVGRLSTAGFRNEQGLEPMGGNLFQASQYSGNPFNSDTMNIIRGGALERANIDYGSTLTQIMVYQKAFEASSKSITTSDEFLQTAIQMKK